MYLFFDTETTGLPRNYNAPIEDIDNWPRLVQIAWIIYDEQGNKQEGFNYIIKPDGFIIPEESSKIHGITDKMAREKGIPLDEALAKFAKYVRDSKLLVAHNMSFDEKIMGAEFLRREIKHELFDTVRFCTMLESAEFCQLPGRFGDYKWPKLQELHIKLFNKGFKNAHDALVDVEATARCFFELMKRDVVKE